MPHTEGHILCARYFNAQQPTQEGIPFEPFESTGALLLKKKTTPSCYLNTISFLYINEKFCI